MSFGVYDPSWRVLRACPVCTKEFVPKRRPTEAQPGIYCSRVCLHIAVKPPSQARDYVERFWEKVIRDGPIVREELGPCWGWKDHTDQEGYARLTVEGKEKLVHRVSWEIHNGPIPDEQDVLHRCDNRPCSRPDHLFLGTHADNMADAASKFRLVPHSMPRSRKLSDQDIEAAKQLFAEGHSLLSIGRLLGVSGTTIKRAVAGYIWKRPFREKMNQLELL